MADILEFMGERQDWISERYDLIRERMEELTQDDGKELFRKEYLSELALFLVDCMRVYDMGEAQILESLSDEEKQQILNQLRQRAEKLQSLSHGEEDPKINTKEDGKNRRSWTALFQVLTELYMPCAAYGMRREQFFLTIHIELFLQLYQIFQMWAAGEETERQAYDAVKEAVYYHLRDYCDIALAYDQRDLAGTERSQQDMWEKASGDRHPELRIGGVIPEGIRGYRELLLSMSETELQEAVKNSVSADCVYQSAVKENTVILVISGLEFFAFSVGELLKRGGRNVIYAGFRDHAWNRLILGYGIREAVLFFDRGVRERLLSEEKNVLEGNKDCLAKLESIVIPGWSEYEKNLVQLDRRTADQNLTQADMGVSDQKTMQAGKGVSDKNLLLYREYLSEVYEMRETFASSIDGRILHGIR